MNGTENVDWGELYCRLRPLLVKMITAKYGAEITNYRIFKVGDHESEKDAG